jgi:hypothetical protein
VFTTEFNLSITFAEVTLPEITIEPLLAANTAVAPPAEIDAENAVWKPPNCPLVELTPFQIDS